MRNIPAYQFDELNPTARLEADKGAVLYACQVLLSSADKCPASAVHPMFETARKEWLEGLFCESGMMRLPPSWLAEPAVGGANDGG